MLSSLSAAPSRRGVCLALLRRENGIVTFTVCRAIQLGYPVLQAIDPELHSQRGGSAAQCPAAGRLLLEGLCGCEPPSFTVSLAGSCCLLCLLMTFSVLPVACPASASCCLLPYLALML